MTEVARPSAARATGAVRLATASDNRALVELFAAVPMHGSLVLSTRRAPDFFALYDVQRAERECWVYDTGTHLAGAATLLVRDGWLDGMPSKVGYLGDLRVTPAGSRDRVLALHYGDRLADAGRKYGCPHFLTAVLASNAAAFNALVRRRRERADQPAYHLARAFSMVSLPFARRDRTRPGGFDVRRASPDDVPEIVALLDRDHRQRPFGYRFDQGEFQHRLASWPGFSLNRTYVARDAGRLVGITTAWDAAPVKRYRVVSYRGRTLWMKRAFNAAAFVLRWTPLPPPGHDVRSLYLCNTAVEEDDPDVFRALVSRVYADFRGTSYHFLSTCEYENDPLAPALEGFTTRRLAFHLYLVTPPGAAAPPIPDGRPGFEMALA
jgi:hypothetical protein